MRRLAASLAALALAIVFVRGAAAQDQKKPEEPKVTRKDIKESDVPKDVLATIKKKYEKGKIVGATKASAEQKTPDGKTDTKTWYELKIKDGSRKVIGHVSSDAKIFLEEELVDFKTLPDAVKKALAGDTKFQRFCASSPDRITLKTTPDEKDEMAYYEVIIDSSNEFWDIVMDKEGHLRKFRKEAHMEGGCHQRF